MLLAVCTVLALLSQPPGARIVAIGDIHGAEDQLVALLERAGLVDSSARWRGDSDVLVQTGDFADRGPRVKEVMDLLRRLETEAAADGGRVVVLLGNHETMNLTANVRDATADIFRSFASSETASKRSAAYLEYAEHAGRRRAALGRPISNLQTRDQWMVAHPPGFLEYMEAMGPAGVYGRWLRGKSVAAVVEDTLFLHGGLSPELRVASVDELNQRVSNEIRRFDEIRAHLIEQDIILPFSTFQEIGSAVGLELDAWVARLAPGPPAPGRPRRSLPREERAHIDTMLEWQGMATWLIIDPDGPLWYRGFARWTDDDGARALPRILERFEVARVVAGHNVTATRRITPRFDGRVFQIDTGMLTSTYGGQPSALELTDDHIAAIYLNGRVELANLTAARP